MLYGQFKDATTRVELNKICLLLSGIAGSLAERLPVLHIVGAPSTALQTHRSLLHHTLNLPNSFSTFSTMSAPLSCSQALLATIEPTTDTTWTKAFDKVLKDVLQQCRPGYVEIPTDAVHAKVSTKGLNAKLVGISLQSRVIRQLMTYTFPAPPTLCAST